MSKQDEVRLFSRFLQQNQLYEKKIQRAFKGDFFIIQSNVDDFVKYLQKKNRNHKTKDSGL